MASSEQTADRADGHPERVSALSHRAPLSGHEGLIMREAVHLGKLVLRLDRTSAMALEFNALQGAAVPTEPCSSAISDLGSISVLWLGPDEWMIVCEMDSEQDVQAELQKTLRGHHHQLCDVTDYYTCIDISGHQTREILMNLTTLDMHPRGFSAGQIKGSIFGHANAFVWQLHTDTGAAESFRLIVRSSMADYLWCLISRSARAFGMPEDTPISGERLVIGAIS